MTSILHNMLDTNTREARAASGLPIPHYYIVQSIGGKDAWQGTITTIEGEVIMDSPPFPTKRDVEDWAIRNGARKEMDAQS